VVIPGSKSITNRALPAALLAKGRSVLDGVLWSDDTEAMLGVIAALGATVEATPGNPRVIIEGVGSDLTPGPLTLDVRMSGTTARFATPLAARAAGPYTIDGSDQMRARPMASTADALRSLGATVDGDTLPMTVSRGIQGGAVTIPGTVSSQFASGLLLAAPGLRHGLELALMGDPSSGEVVSQPYIDMTVAVMRAFGADVTTSDHRYIVPSTSEYQPTDYVIEPDASAASYFFAAAAVTGGRVRIEGLGSEAMQGDVKFVDVLALMGADVQVESNAITVTGTGTLKGVDVDMRDISDTAQTLAAIAPFADGPTRVTGIDFIRNKETDRVAAVVNELTRLGVEATEDEDGFTIHRQPRWRRTTTIAWRCPSPSPASEPKASPSRTRPASTRRSRDSGTHSPCWAEDQATSGRSSADDARSFHDAGGRPIVAGGVVLHDAVVPERNRVRLPSESTLVLGIDGPLGEEADQLG